MDFSKKKILVTGGAGFVGSHLVDRLVKMDGEIYVLDDLINGNEKNLRYAKAKGDIHFICDSVGNASLVHRLIEEEGFDVIFHLAACNLLRSLEDPLHDLMVSGIGTLHILQAMEKCKQKPVLVYSSTGSVYGEPFYQPQDESHPLQPVSPYGISKLAAEKYVLLWNKLYKLNTVALRYYNVYGPRQNYSDKGGVVSIFIHRILSGKPPVIEGDGNQERCFTYVDDVVDANILAAMNTKSYGEVFNIGTTEITTIRKLSSLLLNICGSNLKPLNTSRRIGDIDMFRPDISRAEKIFGYHPKIFLREGLKKTIQWYKNEVGSSV